MKSVKKIIALFLLLPMLAMSLPTFARASCGMKTGGATKCCVMASVTCPGSVSLTKPTCGCELSTSTKPAIPAASQQDSSEKTAKNPLKAGFFASDLEITPHTPFFNNQLCLNGDLHASHFKIPIFAFLSSYLI